MVACQRLKQRSRLREVVGVRVEAEDSGSRAREGGVQQTVVTDLQNLADSNCARGEHVVAIEVFRHANRRLSSAERSATSRAASATRRRCSLAAARIARCANARSDTSSLAAAARTLAISSSVKDM